MSLIRLVCNRRRQGKKAELLARCRELQRRLPHLARLLRGLQQPCGHPEVPAPQQLPQTLPVSLCLRRQVTVWVSLLTQVTLQCVPRLRGQVLLYDMRLLAQQQTCSVLWLA